MQKSKFANFNCIAENIDIILQTLKNEKWTQRRYHLQFATKFSPQKVFDIKIRTPGTAYGFRFYMSKSNFSKSLFDSEEGHIGAFLIKQLVSS